MSSPDILFLMTDQMQARFLGQGNPELAGRRVSPPFPDHRSARPQAG